MNIVCFGGGVNSVALCILVTQQNIKIDYILFSDTLAEKPSTYEYIDYFNIWLKENGQPEIVKLPPYKTEGLYGECIRQKRLPSIVYGFKSCSEKWKQRPFKRFLKVNSIKEFYKYVGYDADESHRIRVYENENHVYPLVDANLERQDCIKLIESVGLKVPTKSACFFCPSSRKSEVHDLKKDYPNLFELATEMERNAKENLTTIKGLGRKYAWEELASMGQFDFSKIEISCDCNL